MRDVFEEIKEIDSELEVVLRSGYRDEDTIEYIQVLQEEKRKLLMKAYS